MDVKDQLQLQHGPLVVFRSLVQLIVDQLDHLYSNNLNKHHIKQNVQAYPDVYLVLLRVVLRATQMYDIHALNDSVATVHFGI